MDILMAKFGETKMIRYFQNRRVVLGVAFAIGIVAVFLFVLFNYSVYRDVANCYAVLTREFAAGNYAGAFHPSLPPLNTTLAGLLAAAGITPLTALTLVSGAFFILTIFPLYGFLQRFLSPLAAAWGCVLYVTAPKVIRFGGTGLLESARNFFIVSALYFFFRCRDGAGWKSALLFGVSLGGMSLARGEGIALAGLLLVLFVAEFRRKHRASGRWRKSLFRLTAIAAFSFLAVIAPRLWQNYCAVGFPSTDDRLVIGLRQRLATGTPYRAPAGSAAPLRERFEYAGKVAGDNLRGAYEPYFALAVLGIILTAAGVRRRTLFGTALPPGGWRAEYGVLAALMAGAFLIFFFSVSAYRYYTVNLIYLMMFTMYALIWLLELLKRHRAGFLVPAGVALLICGNFWNVWTFLAEEEPRREYELGSWLRSQSGLFAPDGRRPVAFSGDVVVWYFTGFDRINEIEKPKPDFFNRRDYDLIILDAEDGRLDRVLSTPDFEEVPGPHPDIARIFRNRNRSFHE